MSSEQPKTSDPSDPKEVTTGIINYKAKLDHLALKAHQQEIEAERKGHETLIDKGTPPARR